MLAGEQRGWSPHVDREHRLEVVLKRLQEGAEPVEPEVPRATQIDIARDDEPAAWRDHPCERRQHDVGCRSHVLDGAHAHDSPERPGRERELFKQAPLEPDPQPRQAARFVESIGIAKVLVVRVTADDVETGRCEQEGQERQPRPRVEQAAARRPGVRPRVWVLPLTAEVAERVGWDWEVVPPDAPGRGEELDLEELERGDDLVVARLFEIGEERIAVACEQGVDAWWDLTGQVGDRPFRPAV
jgi:hypothetical protein